MQLTPEELELLAGLGLAAPDGMGVSGAEDSNVKGGVSPSGTATGAASSMIISKRRR